MSPANSISPRAHPARGSPCSKHSVCVRRRYGASSTHGFTFCTLQRAHHAQTHSQEISAFDIPGLISLCFGITSSGHFCSWGAGGAGPPVPLCPALAPEPCRALAWPQPRLLSCRLTSVTFKATHPQRPARPRHPGLPSSSICRPRPRPHPAGTPIPLPRLPADRCAGGQRAGSIRHLRLLYLQTSCLQQPGCLSTSFPFRRAICCLLL